MLLALSGKIDWQHIGLYRSSIKERKVIWRPRSVAGGRGRGIYSKLKSVTNWKGSARQRQQQRQPLRQRMCVCKRMQSESRMPLTKVKKQKHNIRTCTHTHTHPHIRTLPLKYEGKNSWRQKCKFDFLPPLPEQTIQLEFEFWICIPNLRLQPPLPPRAKTFTV